MEKIKRVVRSIWSLSALKLCTVVILTCFTAYLMIARHHITPWVPISLFVIDLRTEIFYAFILTLRCSDDEAKERRKSQIPSPLVRESREQKMKKFDLVFKMLYVDDIRALATPNNKTKVQLHRHLLSVVHIAFECLSTNFLSKDAGGKMAKSNYMKNVLRKDEITALKLRSIWCWWFLVSLDFKQCSF